MMPREIIAEAWAMTKREKAMRRWGFVASLLQTLLSLKLLIYQSWFFYLYVIKGETISFFAMEELFLTYMSPGVAWTLIITIFAMVAIELVFPHFAQGAVIGLAAKSHTKQPVRGGLVLALYNFMPILIAHEIFVFASLSTVVTVGSLMIRYGPSGDFILLPLWFLVFLWVFSNLLKIICSFTEEAIVIDKLNVFAALGKSIKLILSHLGHVVFLFLLLIVISLRIIINLLMLLIIPGIIIGVGLLLATFLPNSISFTISGIFGFAGVVVAAYFFSYLTVFKQTVWTITYLELSKLKDVDIITEAAEKNMGKSEE